MTILDKIIAAKYQEVEILREKIPVSTLEKAEGFSRSPLSLKKSLTLPESSGIIAEFKRKSPSKGTINNRVNVQDVTRGYVAAGVAGLSVLTDFNFFGGSPNDLVEARAVNQVPILRKDFMIDEYQVIEAKAMGADVILLIAACLTTDKIRTLAHLARSLGLEVLFEIHAREELDKIPDNIDMVGINNRNLKDFVVDLGHSLEIASELPAGFVKVSESGIGNPDTINMLRSNGFQGFLIGENFMKTDHPAQACKEFIDQLKR